VIFLHTRRIFLGLLGVTLHNLFIGSKDPLKVGLSISENCLLAQARLMACYRNAIQLEIQLILNLITRVQLGLALPMKDK